MHARASYISALLCNTGYSFQHRGSRATNPPPPPPPSREGETVGQVVGDPRILPTSQREVLRAFSAQHMTCNLKPLIEPGRHQFSSLTCNLSPLIEPGRHQFSSINQGCFNTLISSHAIAPIQHIAIDWQSKTQVQRPQCRELEALPSRQRLEQFAAIYQRDFYFARRCQRLQVLGEKCPQILADLCNVEDTPALEAL